MIHADSAALNRYWEIIGDPHGAVAVFYGKHAHVEFEINGLASWSIIRLMANQINAPLWDKSEATENSLGTRTSYRFSGHQTFALRIAWLPKAVAAIANGKDPLTNVDEGITTLGLGKNMVESLRCWIEAFQIASRSENRWLLTEIGELVFSPEDGLDPYLEDHCTSWLLHWLICTNTKAPFFAWECLFNRWPSPEFSAGSVLEVFQQESDKNAKSVSAVTLRQHWEVFIHSYRPRHGGKAEDHLDCALSVLGLVREAGERHNTVGRREPVYVFDTSEKKSIPQQLFAFFIHDWWNRYFPLEQTVPLREIIGGNHCPGHFLKMSESELLHRVADLSRSQPEVFRLTESANLRQLRRIRNSDGLDDLRAGYHSPRYA